MQQEQLLPRLEEQVVPQALVEHVVAGPGVHPPDPWRLVAEQGLHAPAQLGAVILAPMNLTKDQLAAISGPVLEYIGYYQREVVPRLVLLVDQLQELMTQCQDEGRARLDLLG